MFAAHMIEALRMLEYRRPMGSKTETAFRDRFLMTLPNAYLDVYGNIHVTVGKGSRVLFSSHTDTVHTIGGFQTLHVDHKTSIVQLSRKAKTRGSNCLGADCTIGVWIMRQMILRGVSGHYVFHYGEEKGGIGSSAIALHCADWLSSSFDYAVAFDRRKRGSIITHQQYYRTASDSFASSLASELARSGLTFAADDGGIYTDTAEYADHIAECTNLSVGYVNEHRDSETCDLEYADQVMRAISAVDWTKIDKVRDPLDHDANDDLNWTWIGKGSQSVGSFAYDPAYRISGNVSHAIDRKMPRTYSGAAGDPVFGTCITCGDGTWIDRRSFNCIDCESDEDPNNPANHATTCPTYDTGEYSDCDCYWRDVIEDARTPSDRSHDRSIYLSDEYAAVQQELIDTLKRRQSEKHTRSAVPQDQHAILCRHYSDGCAECTCGVDSE